MEGARKQGRKEFQRFLCVCVFEQKNEVADAFYMEVYFEIIKTNDYCFQMLFIKNVIQINQ